MPIYMKIEDDKGKIVVPGDVTACDHYQWIELHSCQLGTARRTSSPTGGSGDRETSKPALSEIVCTKDQDIASAKLFQLSLSGEAYKVTIDFMKTEKGVAAPYLSLTLENTLISNYSLSGAGGAGHDRPMESLTLNTTSIKYTTKPTSTRPPDGSPDQVMWDVATASML
jgi:type VI secretion system secreted protein Hcp